MIQVGHDRLHESTMHVTNTQHGYVGLIYTILCGYVLITKYAADQDNERFDGTLL